MTMAIFIFIIISWRTEYGFFVGIDADIRSDRIAANPRTQPIRFIIIWAVITFVDICIKGVKKKGKTKCKMQIASRRTVTSFPVICQHVAFGTSAIGRAKSVEARVRATAIVATALVDIFAQMSISCQLSSWHILTVAIVGAVSIMTSALTRAMPITQRAFINI